MKPKIAIFVNRPVTSRYNKSLIEQMLFLKEYSNKYDFVWITNSKTPAGMRYVTKQTGITFRDAIYCDELYDVDVNTHKYENWLDFRENANWFTDDYDHIVMFGGMLSANTCWNRKKAKLERMLNTRGQMKYEALGRPLSVLVQLCKYADENDIPFHEICYDTDENSLSIVPSLQPKKYFLYHGYDLEDYGMRRLDSLTYYLNNEEEDFFTDVPEKFLTLTFGYTILTPDREHLHETINNIVSKLDKDSYELFVKHKSADIDTFVDRDTYLRFIDSSNYTLIAVPYDPRQFSIYRFQESISRGCLPLILEDVYVEDFIHSFGIDKKCIDKIMVRNNTLPDLSENERINILNYFRDKVLRTEKLLEI